MRFAVITGAAGGIGQALVHAFTGAGYAVIATDRHPTPPSLPCHSYLQADLERTVNDLGYAEEIFTQIRAEVGDGALKVLVNNAAVQALGGADSLKRADWRLTLDVNLVAPFVWTQALLPALEASRGCVVNISSIHARLTKAGFVAYATSKSALSGMTRALAVDLGHRVRVNAIEPAAIETEMLKAGFSDQPGLYAQLEQAHPTGCIGQPKEVAALALALSDGQLVFLNGACVALDGGVGARLHDPG